MITIRARNEMRQLRASGHSYGQIANLFCIDPQLAHYHCRDIEGPRAKHGRPRKFNYSRAAKMRADGFTYREIAERFGVSIPNISYALRTHSKTGEGA